MSLTRNFAHFVSNHFRLYRTLTPWAFCWRITIEGTAVSLLLAMGLMAFDLEQRDIPFNNAMFFIVGVFVAPVLETLLLQSFPVFVARLFKARFSIQVLSSLVPFAFLHFLEGAPTGLAAGLVGGDIWPLRMSIGEACRGGLVSGSLPSLMRLAMRC
jgi:hypothetical protein